jgi:hypothetical protein
MAKRIFAQRFTETPPPEFFTSGSEVRGKKYMTSGRRIAVWALGERRDELQEEGGSPGFTNCEPSRLLFAPNFARQLCASVQSLSDQLL